MQSQLTNLNVEEIESQGECSLTPYRESMRLHIPFITSIQTHLEHVLGKKLQICPIT